MKLNIINQSSSIELTNYQIAFMESVLEYIVDVEYGHSFLHFLNIPIFLVEHSEFKRIKEKYDNENNINDLSIDDYEKINYYDLFDEIDSNIIDPDNKFDPFRDKNQKRKNIYKNTMSKTIEFEVLGLYWHNYSILSSDYTNKQPAIYLNLEYISELSKDHNDFLYLTTLVLLHELSHYKIDIGNDNYYPRDEFYIWMEESMANCITLSSMYGIINMRKLEFLRYQQPFYKNKFFNLNKHALRNYIDLFDYSFEFVLNQPKHYQLGCLLFIYGNNRIVDFAGSWATDKQVLKTRQINEKQNWLNYVKKNVIKDKGAFLQKYYEDVFIHHISRNNIYP
jgi:hypothetical protein